MALNFLGIPLIILLVASVIGILLGIVRKNKRIMWISVIVLIVVLLIYIILFLIVH
jgi:ABC-type microcin C transport system permease subunit YejE